MQPDSPAAGSQVAMSTRADSIEVLFTHCRVLSEKHLAVETAAKLEQ